MMEGLSKDEKQLALEIMNKTNAIYQQLLVSEGLLETNFKRIMEFPTTFFVDKEGNIAGEKVTGANDKEGWKKIIEERLQMDMQKVFQKDIYIKEQVRVYVFQVLTVIHVQEL